MSGVSSIEVVAELQTTFDYALDGKFIFKKTPNLTHLRSACVLVFDSVNNLITMSPR